MSHPDARLTPQSRLDLVLGVAGGWTQAEAARQFRVSRATAAKQLRRYRDEGRGGLRDRCSRPHRIAWDLGVAPSTAYAVLRRAGLHRRDRRHRVSREVVRYERERPGVRFEITSPSISPPAPRGGWRPCARRVTSMSPMLSVSVRAAALMAWSFRCANVSRDCLVRL